jgi:ATP-dependent RNA helicase DDX56/DBP9
MDLAFQGAQFDSFGLDGRLLQGIADMSFLKPTPVQAACIPIALRGKDVLARAQTGTGKTAAYGLPVIQNIINSKKALNVPFVRAVVLVPTRDLCSQTAEMFAAFLKHLKNDVACVNLAAEQKAAERHQMLKSKPDIVISTPNLLFQQLSSMSMDLSQLVSLVIDEADVVVTESDQLASVKQHLPSGCQTLMLSATLTAQVMLLKDRLMQTPFVVKTQADQDTPLRVTQYFVRCKAVADKYMAFLGMMMVGEITGKSIIFVNNIHTATRLSIFLDMFKISTAVLSSDIPENSRNDIVRQFNRNQVQHLIATDEGVKMDDVSRRKAELESGVANSEDVTEADGTKKRKRSHSIAGAGSTNEPKRRQLQGRIERIHAEAQERGEYGVHRGIDFHAVDWVVNFDVCRDAGAYTHRIGRTGRADREGHAISFFVDKDQDALLLYLQEDQRLKGYELVEHPKPAQHWEKLRLRVEDTLESISAKVIDKARVQLLAKEVVKSKKLKNHWRSNPEDLQALTRLAKEKPPHIARAAGYLSHMPSYMGLEKPADKEAPKKEKEPASWRASMAKGRFAKKAKVQPNAFSLRLYAQAKRAEQQMTDMELSVIDPNALVQRRKMRDRADFKRKASLKLPREVREAEAAKAGKGAGESSGKGKGKGKGKGESKGKGKGKGAGKEAGQSRGRTPSRGR